MFQAGPLSRHEAQREFQPNSKPLKRRKLRLVLFGTRPAFNKPGSGIKNRGIVRVNADGESGREVAQVSSPLAM
jgi:hypothetical protein